jgi:hypothetical protein
MSQLSFDHLLNLSFAFHTRRKTGEILRVLDRGVAINRTLEVSFFFLEHSPSFGHLFTIKIYPVDLIPNRPNIYRYSRCSGRVLCHLQVDTRFGPLLCDVHLRSVQEHLEPLFLLTSS